MTDKITTSEKPIINKRSFSSDVLKLTIGATVAQGVAILSMPVITHLYSPEAFGVAALFISITTILGSVTCLRYEMAIVLPEKEEVAANILGVCLISVCIVSAFILPPILMIQKLFPQWTYVSGLGPYLWLIPLFNIFNGIYTILNYWLSRRCRYGDLSMARAASTLSATGTKLAAGFMGHASGGVLIGSSVIGAAISASMLGARAWLDNISFLRASITAQGMASAAVRYKKFPLYDSWTGLLNSISWQMPVLMFSFFFSSKEVGFYALAFTVFQLPMSLVGTSIAQVFLQRASDAKKEGTLAGLVESTFEKLTRLGLMPALALSIIGQDVFLAVFGPAWSEAGIYIQILSVWFFIWFLSSPLDVLSSVLEKQEFGLKVNIVIFVTRFLSLWAGGLMSSARAAIILFSLSGIVVYGYLCIAMMAYSDVELRSIRRIVSREMIRSMPTLIAIIAVKYLIDTPLIKAAALLFIAAAYVLYLLKTWKSE